MNSFDFASTDFPADIYLPKGMLSGREIEAYYFIAHDLYSGSGQIFDLGSFCGNSAYAFAAGVRDSVHVDRARLKGSIRCFDLFATTLAGPRAWIQNNFFSSCNHQGTTSHRRRVIDGEFDYSQIFRWQLRGFEDLITIEKGDFLLFRPDDDTRIEILMVDLAKTLELNAHYLNNCVPFLMPGGILIHQDFFIPQHYYIPVTMQCLKDSFSVMAGRVGGSRIYRLEQNVSPQQLHAAAAFGFSYEEAAGIFDEIISEADPDTVGNLLLSKAYMARDFSQTSESATIIDQIMRDYPSFEKRIKKIFR